MREGWGGIGRGGESGEGLRERGGEESGGKDHERGVGRNREGRTMREGWGIGREGPRERGGESGEGP